MNRKLNILAICLLLFLFTSQSQAWWGQKEPPELAKRAQPSVVTIITYDKNGKRLGQGSGFFVDGKGHLITNYHILKRADHAKVKTHDGIEYSVKSIIAENRTMDLVKVLAHVPHGTYKGMQIVEHQPDVAERILVVGSPMGLEQTVSDGIISAIREIPNKGKVYQISAPISPGSSGSPVINMKGEVIGVASFYLVKGQNLNFAIPGQYVLNLPEMGDGKTVAELSDLSDTSDSASKELLERAEFFILTHKYKQAISLLKQIIEKEPKNAMAWCKLGRYYCRRKQYKDAIKALENAIRLNSNLLEAYDWMGATYSNIGLHEDALAAYKKAIRINPDYNAYYGIGYTYEKLGLPYRAIDAYKQCIRVDPDNDTCHYNLGYIYVDLGLRDAALRQYDIMMNIARKKQDTFLRNHIEGWANRLLQHIETQMSPPSTASHNVEVIRDGDYTASNGIVTDTKTGLEWVAGPDREMTWNEAKVWVKSLNIVGTGWRMPTIKELATLYKKGKGTRNMTYLLETSGWLIWSGDTKGPQSARGLNFATYEWFWAARDKIYLDIHAFAVRSRR